MLEFRILGPLEVLAAGETVPIGAGREQRILATLVVSANRTVSFDALVDALWPECPPETARNQVRNCTAGVRRALVAAGLPPAGLERCLVGYRLRAEPRQFDHWRFEDLVGQGHHRLRSGEREAAVERWRAADDLWRGPALAGLDQGRLQAEALRLEEMRLQAVEARVSAELALGRHHRLLPELFALAHEHTGRDRLQAALIGALHRCGRTGEALTAFEHLRRRTRDEFGCEPGAPVRRLREEIMAETALVDSRR